MTDPEHLCRIPRVGSRHLGDRWSCYLCSSSWELVRYAGELGPRRVRWHRVGPDLALWRRRHRGSWLARLADQALDVVLVR